MNPDDKRDEWDRHNRDEARARAEQQEAAGGTHQPVPVQAYATSTVEPAPGDVHRDVAVLIEEYERATTLERASWLTARSQLASAERQPSWNEWRDAVERTQRAAQSLVNYGIARSASG